MDEEDPAIDQSGADWRSFYVRAMELGELGSLPLRTGAEPPVVWRFRHLSADEITWAVDRVQPGKNNLASNLDLLALALVAVRGVKTEDGQPLELKRARDPRRGGFEAVKSEQLDMLLRDEKGFLDTGRLIRLSNRVWSDIIPPQG
ncbi:MAG TPA: hypothetical protein VFX99_03415 [Microbacterium sp.]|nr:hypothetical protein [Microbacterium sp.]